MFNVTFSGIKACVFDAYGTLFDVHSAVARHRLRLGDSADQISATWRTKQLEYTWLRSLMGRYADFWQVTSDALGYALEANGIDDPALHEELINAYLSLECYPEVPEVLTTLRRAGMGGVPGEKPSKVRPIPGMMWSRLFNFGVIGSAIGCA